MGGGDARPRIAPNRREPPREANAHASHSAAPAGRLPAGVGLHGVGAAHVRGTDRRRRGARRAGRSRWNVGEHALRPGTPRRRPDGARRGLGARRGELLEPVPGNRSVLRRGSRGAGGLAEDAPRAAGPLTLATLRPHAPLPDMPTPKPLLSP